MAVLLDGAPAARHVRPDEPAQRPPDLLQGPRVAAVLLDAQGGRGRSTTRSCSRSASSASRLEGHPTPRIPPTDVATGSLGQGLPIAVGVALAGKRLDRLPYRVWCLCGDSEMAEGSMWEAFEHAGFNGLDNLTAIIDVNRLGQTRETMVGWDLDRYRPPRRGVRLARDRDRRPRRRGDRGRVRRGRRRPPGGRPRSSPARRRARASRRSRTCPASTASRSTTPTRRSRSSAASATCRSRSPSPRAASRTGSRRPAASCRLGRSARRSRPARRTARRSRRSASMRGDVVALDGEVSNSTHSEHVPRGAPGPLLRDVHRRAAAGRRGGRACRCAAGCRSPRRSRRSSRARTTSSAWRRSRARTCACRARTPASRSARTARRRWRSRTSPRSARSTARPCCTRPTPTRRRSSSAAMADREGISFMRTLRGKTTVRTPAGEDVRIGGSRGSLHEGDDVAIVACGITVDQAVEAAEALAGDGIAARVIDCLLDQADRRGGDPRRGARVRPRSSPSRTTGPRAGWATRCSRRWRRPTTARRSTSSRSARCPGRARRTSCWHEAGIDAEGIAAAARTVARERVG